MSVFTTRRFTFAAGHHYRVAAWSEDENARTFGRLTVPHRLAEVSAQGPGEEAPVLHDEWIVEAHRLAEATHVLRRRLRRQQHQRGIAREVQDQEDDERHAEQDHQRLPQSPDEERPHARVRRATASMWGVWGNMSTGCTQSSR